ncbi:hypothetical protein DPEC_G00338920 [Dallia pectoralis]|uniref:Uncharacterized protein n=1 Tax=Dallia pectoralis TaxID=75939 RepID=A0ACC2F4Q9_DALPE|nr:hypothetical protein DPEC_G00338920 [Dallia pectoralis]
MGDEEKDVSLPLSGAVPEDGRRLSGDERDISLACRAARARRLVTVVTAAGGASSLNSCQNGKITLSSLTATKTAEG